MSADVWPPIAHDELLQKEEESLKAELKWLLELLQENLGSLKNGLQECVALLASEEPGTTLAISSHRSESVKGFVTRVGTRLVKGELSLRLSTLPPTTSSGATTLSIANPLPIPQLQTLLTLLNHALDIIDISSYTGDPQDPGFISSQLKLLGDTLEEAQSVLRGGEDVPGGGGRWYDNDEDESSTDMDADNPGQPSSTNTNTTTRIEDTAIAPSSLSSQLSTHFSITQTALTLSLRTTYPAQPSRTPSPNPFSSLSASNTPSPGTSTPTPAPSSGFTSMLRTRLGLGPKVVPHDEQERVFRYRGAQVGVREKVVVESQDPGLLAIGAKLGVVGREVEGWKARVMVVMSGGLVEQEKGDDDDGDGGGGGDGER